MKFGFYADNQLPESVVDASKYNVNSHGYRCPEWKPLPVGKKNVVVLGCSHTFGEGLEDGEVWVDKLYAKVDQKRLRFWNLGQPGASADKIVRILYGTEKILFAKHIIVCWPVWSRRERLENYPKSITGSDQLLKTENEQTDKNNFLKNVFLVEKFAEKTGAVVFHCFAQDAYNISNANVLLETSIRSCWPNWSTLKTDHENRILTTKPSVAKDGLHYGVEHHEMFAQLFYEKFRSDLR